MKIGIESSVYFSGERLVGYEQGIATMRRHGYDGMDFQNFINTNNDLFTCSLSEFERKLTHLRSCASENGIAIH